MLSKVSKHEVLDNDLQIITSTLYHPELTSIDENTKLSGDASSSTLYMLKYHQERMLAAILDLEETPRAMHDAIAGTGGLESMRQLASATSVTAPSKIRFALDRNGDLTCKALDLGTNILLKISAFFPIQFPYPAAIPENEVRWLVGVSQYELRPGFTTKHKTNQRLHYTKAMQDAPDIDLGEHKVEMLVVNNKHQIMEGCITTPYFWKNGAWITPSADCGGNLGTTRRWALEKGVAREGIVMKDDLAIGQTIVLSNGVWGFGLGRIIAV